MLAIYKKELRAYFNSFIGYVFMALFLAVFGVYFFATNLMSGYAHFEYTLSSITFIFVLIAPLLTMRLMAEENKQKTDQLLFTSPATATSIVVGKLLAVLSLFVMIMLIICLYPLIMSLYGTVPLAPAYASILAFTLLGAAYLSIGLYISSLTENQIVAAVISFVVFIFTMLMEGIASLLPSDNKSALVIFTIILLIICMILHSMMHNLTISVLVGAIGEAALVSMYLLKPTLYEGSVAKVFGWFSVSSRFNNFASGVFDVSGIIYYISITCLFTFLTVQVIKKKRWS